MPTVAEIKDSLDERGIEYDSKAKKAELEDLLPTVEPQDDENLKIAVNALEQIADTEQGAHGDQVITSVQKAANVAQNALDRIA